MSTTSRRWVRAGVRADAGEARRIVAKRAQARYFTERRTEEARKAHAAGLLRPYALTTALNARGLWGPDVDAACGAQEPDVDNWENGDLYPTWEQVLALSRLTGFAPWYFYRDHHILHADETSLRFHLPPSALEPDPVILRYTTTALAAAGIHPNYRKAFPS